MKKLIPLFCLLLCSIAMHAEVQTGSCGDNLTWQYDTDTKALTITGTGKMSNYYYYLDEGYAPWYEYQGDIAKILIADGVTSIGNYAFYYCTSLTSITIPASVTSIGYDAFYSSCGTIIFESLTPPNVKDRESTLSRKNVYVPCEALETYIQAWGDIYHQIEGVSYKVIPNATEGGIAELSDYDCATNTAVIEAKVTADAHKFLKWSDGNTDNPRTLVLTQDTTLTAEFVECPYHMVIIGGVDIYGTYYRFEESYDPVGFYGTSFKTGDTLSVCEGQKVTFTEQHECGTWLGWSDGVADRERTIIVISDTVISSRFDAKTYRLSITAGEGGSLYSGNFVGIRTECQGTIWRRAEANDGYYFTGWSDGMMNADRDFEIFQDTTVVALFALKVPVRVFTGVAENSTDMGIAIWNGEPITGSVINVSATPNEGYHFVEWSDGNAQAERTIYLTRDTTLYATFAAGTYGGKCGPNLYWTWNKTTQVLLITGTGAMDTEHYAHWESIRDIDTVSLISLPDGIATISQSAFSGWDSYVIYQVKNISIPASVEYIGNGAFDGCRTVEHVEYLGNTAIVEGYACYADGALSYAQVPANFIEDRAYAIDTLIITNGEIKRLYQYAASYMNLSAASNTDTEFLLHSDYNNTYSDFLRALILPAGLESIGADALRGCRYLQQITIPAGVKEIGTSAFEDCRSLSAVTFAGKNLEAIGDWAFYNCHNLRQIALPEGLQEIGTAAFYGCTFLSDLTIPSTTQKIAENAFALCAKMAKMYVNALVPPAIGAKTFEDVDRSIPVFVPKGTLERYQGDPYWSEFFNITEYDAPTGILNAAAQGEDNARKVLRNGQVLIIRGDQTYTVLGDKL